jgi:hypothetical protein
MKRASTITGIALVAAFALSALVATNVSALNLAKKSCVKLAPGDVGLFAQQGCRTPETGGPTR